MFPSAEAHQMKIVTINLPLPALDALEKLTDYGLYPSRSEAIRVALRDFLSSELQLAQKLKQVQAEMHGDEIVEAPIPQ